jgi:uncharacterized repeat protein (TIGR02543 family)
MKLSFKNILPILLIFTLLILLAGCFTSPEYTPPTYTVTYDDNNSTGGTVPVDLLSPYEESVSVTVLGNTGILVRTGYTFDDWNTAADGSGTWYEALETFNMGTANVTLYAQWTASPGYAGGEGECEWCDCEVPIADAGGPYSETVCPGIENNKGITVAMIDFVGSGNGIGTLSYAWDFDNNGVFDSTLQNPQYAFEVGVHIVTLQVTNICGSTTDTATVTIDLCVNNAPTIISITDQDIAQGNTFNFTVSANANDLGDNLFYEIVSGPLTMTIDSDTGEINWVANCLDLDRVTSRCDIICSKQVTVKVTDTRCCPLSAQDTFTINVWDELSG